MKEIPQTYCQISKKILQTVIAYNAGVIVIISIAILNSLIKDNEHALRVIVENRNYVISGSDQIGPSDFLAEKQKRIKKHKL